MRGKLPIVDRQPEGLLSVYESAALLGLSPHTIRTWLRQQRITHVRLGRRVLLERDSLQRFVRSHVVKAKRPHDLMHEGKP